MFGISRPTRAKKVRRLRPLRTRLFLEPLEDRTLLSVSIAGTIFNDLLPDHPGVPGATAFIDVNHTGVVVQNGDLSVSGPTTLASSDPIGGTLGVSDPLMVSGVVGPISNLTLHLDIQKSQPGPVFVALLSPQGFVQQTGPDLLILNPKNGNTARFNGTIDDSATGVVNIVGNGTTAGNFRPTTIKLGPVNDTSNAFAKQGYDIYSADPNGGWRLLFYGLGSSWNTTGLTINSWSLEFTGSEQTAIADSSGNYTFSNLQPGPVRVAAVSSSTGPNPSADVVVPENGPVSNVNLGIQPSPDLLGTSFSVSGNNIDWGSSVTVYYTVANRGQGDAPATNAEIRLSSTGVIDPSASLLATVAIPALAAGASYTGSKSVQLPGSPGSPPAGFNPLDLTYLGLRIDPNDALTETNKDNNANQGQGIDLAPVVQPSNTLISSTGGQSEAGAQQMPSLAVDPTDSNHLVLSYMDYSLGGAGTIGAGYAGIAVATSHDGGTTWTHTTLPLPSGYDQAAGYPHAVFDATGHVYIAFMAAKFFGQDPPLIFPDGSRDGSFNLLRSYGLQSNNGIFVARSDDGGATWDPSNVFAVQANTYSGTKVPWDVLPSIAADNTPSSPGYGDLYVTWYRIYPAGMFPFSAGNSGTQSGGSDIMFAVGAFTQTANPGQNWSVQYKPGTQIPVIRDTSGEVGNAANSEGAGSVNFSQVTVDPSGNIYVAFFDSGPFVVYKSTNGGSSFSAVTNPFTVGTNLQFADTTLYTNGPSHVFPVRDIVADPSRPNTVYVADAIRVPNLNSLSSNPPLVDKAQIDFAYTNDGGNGWQQTFTVGSNVSNFNDLTPSQQQNFTSSLNDDNGEQFLGYMTPDQLANQEVSTQALPRLAVDAQGNLVAIWYDMRRDPSGNPTLVDVYGSISTDGGATWSPNFRITTQSFSASGGSFIDASGSKDTFLGDYIALATAGGTAYAAWTDTRNGNQDIYFSRFAITAPVASSGDRFEPNNTSDTPTNLGSVSVPHNYPQLTLTGGDEDWFLLKAGDTSTGGLKVSVTGGSGMQLELYDAVGNLLATGTPILDASGHEIGQQIVANSVTNHSYYVHVFGVPPGAATVTYTLSVQCLTADLGTQVHDTLSAVPLPSGAIHRYLATMPLTGLLSVTLSIPTPSTGSVIFQVQDTSGNIVHNYNGTNASATIKGSATSAHFVIPVTAGESLVLVLTGATATYTLDYSNLDQFQSSSVLSDTTGIFTPTPGTPTAIAIGDLNGDNHPDVVIGTQDFSNPVDVLLNQGNGVLDNPQGYEAGPSGTGPRGLVLDTFTGTSALDVATTNYQSADVSLLLSQADGTLQPDRRFDSTPTPDAIASGDFAGNGIRDLAVLQRLPASGTASQLAILMGRGDGTFLPPILLDTTVQRGAGTVVVADFNGDGKDDIAVFGFNTPSIDIFLSTGLDSNGQITFAPVKVINGPENVASAVAADLNQDHNMDLVVGGTNSGNVFVLLGNGDGTFEQAKTYAANTDSLKAAASVAGLYAYDYTGDGYPDIFAVTIPRIGNGLPQINFLQNNAGVGAAWGGLASPFQILTGNFTGPVAVADLNGDHVAEIVLAETGGVRVIYGKNLPSLANNTLAHARDLGTVVHTVLPAEAISPSYANAYFKLTVPTEAAPGAGDEILDISGLFQYLSGAGLSLEVLDANGNPLPASQVLEHYRAADGSGERYRIRAPQGTVLYVHVFGLPGAVPAAGAYTLDIDVLPQVVSAAAHWLLPGQNGQPGSPANSIVLTLQGDRLDPATAEDPANYRVIWAGPDGVLGTADDQVIPLGSIDGGQPVVYDPGVNIVPSTGVTYPTAVQQTITLYFANSLPVGTYLIELSSAIQAAPFNTAEASLLVSTAGFTGHPLVSLDSNGHLVEGDNYFAKDLVLAAGSVGDLSAISQGSAYLTQFHGNSGALLNSLLQNLGDSSSITSTLNGQVATAIGPATGNVPILVIWLDPVSIDLADPQGARTVYNLQSNTVQNANTRAFVETGGNIEVMVLMGLTGTFTLNISDVQSTARGGAVAFNDGEVQQTMALTDAIRGGSRTFELSVNGSASAPVPGAPSEPGTTGTVATTTDTTTTTASNAGSTTETAASAPGLTGSEGPDGGGAILGSGFGGASAGGVSVVNAPVVSAVLFLSVVLQSGATTLITASETLGNGLEGEGELDIAVNGRSAIVAAVGGPNARITYIDPSTARLIEQALRDLVDSGITDLGGYGGTMVNSIRAVLRTLGSNQQGVRPAGPAPMQQPAPEEENEPEEILWLDPLAEMHRPQARAIPQPTMQQMPQLAAPQQEVHQREEQPVPMPEVNAVAVPMPVEHEVLWVDGVPEQVALWAADAPADPVLVGERSADVSALFGLGMLAAGLCLPVWIEGPEERRPDERSRRDLRA